MLNFLENSSEMKQILKNLNLACTVMTLVKIDSPDKALELDIF